METPWLVDSINDLVRQAVEIQVEEMARAGTLKKERVQATLIGYLGADDGRVAKLTEL